MIASTLLAAIVFLAPPNPGSLPFPVPPFPKVPAAPTPEIDLAPMEHTEEYEDRATEIEAQIDTISETFGVEGSTTDLWAEMPAMDGSENFETGIDVIDDEYGGLSNVATSWGEQIQTFLAYAKAVSSLAGTAAGFFYITLLLASTWLFFVRGLCISISFVGFLLSAWVKIRESIPFVGYLFGG